MHPGITNTYTISFTLEGLFRFIHQEYKLFGKVEHKVKLLRNKLEAMNNGMEAPESRSMAAEFVKQIRKAAYDAEDIIDKYIIDVKRLARRKKETKVVTYYFGGHRAMFGNVSESISNLITEIDEIFENIKKIATGGVVVEANNANETMTIIKDVDVAEAVEFGNEYRRTIVSQLKEGDQQLQLKVISIVGMSGSGKKMLANILRMEVKNDFDCCIVVNSEGKAPELLLVEIIRKLRAQQQVEENLKNLADSGGGQNEGLQRLVNEFIEKMPKMTANEIIKSASQLFKRIQRIIPRFQASDHKIKVVSEQEIEKSGTKEMLEECLQDIKYFIIMNDVQEAQLWDAFPDNNKGSRILITTRLRGIHPDAKYPIHYITMLNEAESWKLVRKIVFGEEECPAYLESKGKKVSDFCDGLPLALVIMGRILKEKLKNEENWDHLDLSDGRMQWRDKIGQSYQHLPTHLQHLKLCFYYLGVFPRNYEISVKELLQFWILEGLIPQDNNKSQERVAEEYLNQLISSCLIKATSHGIDGRVKTCHVHNVVLDLCLYESQKQDFYEVRKQSNLLFRNMPRRLSVHCSPQLFDSSLLSQSCDPSIVRSFLWFGSGTEIYSIDGTRWQRLRKTIDLVRILYLGNVQFESFPKGIDQLIYLKYLKLKGTAIKYLPNSIHNLRYLVTLDLKDSTVNSLPSGVWKLQNLRHVFSSQPIKLPLPPKKSPKTLPSLQVLSILLLDQHTLLLFNMFPLVTKLGLLANSGHVQPHPPAIQQVFQNLPTLNFLEKLKITFPSNDHLVYQQRLLASSLRQLTLLTKLSLVRSNINYNDFEAIGNLPGLRYLKVLEGKIDNNNDDGTLECASNSFPQLEIFQMKRFSISSLGFLKGSSNEESTIAMRNLRSLIIKDCTKLRVIIGMEGLTNLKQVNVHGPCHQNLQLLLQRTGTLLRQLQLQIY